MMPRLQVSETIGSYHSPLRISGAENLRVPTRPASPKASVALGGG